MSKTENTLVDSSYVQKGSSVVSMLYEMLVKIYTAEKV